MTEQVISPLRRRMIEDMAIRKFAPKTQQDYVQRAKEFAAFLGHSPDTAGAQEVRRFQLHLVSSGAGTPKINATVSALRFFFNVTLGRADLAKPLATLRQERKAPVILSPEEVARFLEAAPSLKYKVALSVAYGARLRVSEVVALKVSDIGSFAIVLRRAIAMFARSRCDVVPVRRWYMYLATCMRMLAMLPAHWPRPRLTNNRVGNAKRSRCDLRARSASSGSTDRDCEDLPVCPRFPGAAR
jgi:integrase